ncbi:MAG: YhcH/YjgK/YiaL family protein [Oscillospiraceae bacterium]
MIIDRYSELGKYAPLLPKLPDYMAQIEALWEHPVGRYDCGECYLMIQEGGTIPVDQGNFEAHRRYIDLQIVTRGKEEVEWQAIGHLTPLIPYDAERDAEFFSDGGLPFAVTEGMFYLLYPSDGHKPCVHTEGETSYRKLVLKIPVL